MEQQNKVHAEVKFKGLLILIHTPYGLTFFDKVARTSAARIYAKFNVYLMPLITALAIFLIVGSLMAMFSNATAREGARNMSLKYMLLIPGLNPYIPWSYGWIALVISIIIHEAGHGIVARVYGIKVQSTGLVLILGGLPIGAFVNIERHELEKATLKYKSAILTAGPLNNMVLAAISLITLYLLVSTLSPLPISSDERQFSDVLVVSVSHGSLAESLDISKGSIIESIAGQKVHAIDNVSNLLRSKLGNKIEITWYDETGKKITRSVILPKLEKGGILGASIKNKPNVAHDSFYALEKYKSFFGSNPMILLLPMPSMAQELVPYSDLMAPRYESRVLGQSFPIFGTLLFWLWYINFYVGIFNALPIGPLDGGQLYNSFIKTKTKSLSSTRTNIITIALTVIMITIIIMSILLPWIIL